MIGTRRGPHRGFVALALVGLLSAPYAALPFCPAAEDAHAAHHAGASVTESPSHDHGETCVGMSGCAVTLLPVANTSNRATLELPTTGTVALAADQHGPQTLAAAEPPPPRA